MCRMSTTTFFIACLLAVCVWADESACDCSSETAKVTTFSSQVKKLEGELEASKSSSKKNEADLKKSEADLKTKVKELETSQKKVQELEAAQATAQATSQKTEATLQKKVKELEGSHADSGKKSETEINSLKSQVKELSDQLEKAKKSKEEAASALQECGEISMIGFASKVGSMTNGVVKHALEQTDFDDKLATQVHTHVGTATGAAGKMATSFKDSIASVNYTDVMERLSSSQAYQKVTDTVAEKTQSLMPHIEKARVTLEPHLTKAKNMAGPTWEKAQPTLDLLGTKALETYHAGADAVQTHVLPVLKRGGSSALDQASSLALAQLEKIMTPTFDAIGKAVPEHANTLPTHAVDRALFLLVGVVLAYYSLYFVRVALRITVRLAARTSLMSLRLFKLIVMIPLRILLYLIDFAWWVATLFYCCGLCRKKKAGKVAAKAKKEEKKNGAPTAAKVETVTAAECQALFEASKEKNKLEEGAKSLAKYVKEKKPLGSVKGGKAPSVQGKVLTKEVFLQTCKKFKVNITEKNL